MTILKNQLLIFIGFLSPKGYVMWLISYKLSNTTKIIQVLQLQKAIGNQVIAHLFTTEFQLKLELNTPLGVSNMMAFNSELRFWLNGNAFSTSTPLEFDLEHKVNLWGRLMPCTHCYNLLRTKEERTKQGHQKMGPHRTI